MLAGKPKGNFFHGKSINFGTPYYTITIAFNIFVTVLIIIRLRKLRKAVSGAIGEDSARIYTSVASTLIESAAPYSVVGIMFLIPYALGNGTAVAFGQVWAKIAVCVTPFTCPHRSNGLTISKSVCLRSLLCSEFQMGRHGDAH